jgi:5-(carboxyamino)imidazole ribonucleotide synthase
MVPFEREVSIIAVRSRSGAIAFYPLSENHHREGILRLTLSRPGDPMQAPAETAIRRIMEDLDYVGVLALELFQLGNQLLANEMAPRVHNTGHWTIEGARTSQFENHVRAVCDLPLGDTTIVEPSAMVNLIGRLPDEAAIRSVPDAVPHFYGKAERPGRKVGHITLCPGESSPQEFRQRLSRLLRLAGETELAETDLGIQ